MDTVDIALVIATDADRVHLVEQYRHPVAGRRWEFPSGSADQPGDAEPAALAARELREETGLLAGTLTLLGTLEISPGTITDAKSTAAYTLLLLHGPASPVRAG